MSIKNKVNLVLPIILHSFFQAFHLVHENSFAGFDRVNEQVWNSPHLLVTSFSLISFPPQCSKTHQDQDR